MTSKLSAEDANAFLDESFGDNVDNIRLIKMEKSNAVMRCVARPFDLRKDGYFSAPALMALADSIAYFAILTETGKIEKLKTTNLNINFIKPCMGTVAIAEGRLIKIGTSLATIEAHVRPEGEDEPACRAIITYSLPPNYQQAHA